MTEHINISWHYSFTECDLEKAWKHRLKYLVEIKPSTCEIYFLGKKSRCGRNTVYWWGYWLMGNRTYSKDLNFDNITKHHRVSGTQSIMLHICIINLACPGNFIHAKPSSEFIAVLLSSFSPYGIIYLWIKMRTNFLINITIVNEMKHYMSCSAQRHNAIRHSSQTCLRDTLPICQFFHFFLSLEFSNTVKLEQHFMEFLLRNITVLNKIFPARERKWLFSLSPLSRLCKMLFNKIQEINIQWFTVNLLSAGGLVQMGKANTYGLHYYDGLC